MCFKKIMVLIALCVLFAGCSTGAYHIASYEKEGNAKLGMRYLLGRGVPQDNAKAFFYFSRAAHEGDIFAQNELAYLYAAGKGTERNDVQALKWYHKAAARGLASAQYNLGLMYQYGLGTTPNKKLAKTWIEKSAAHGFEPAKKTVRLL